MKLQKLKPSQLTTAKYNPKSRTEKQVLKPLLESIRTHGILYPLLADEKFNLIDGHRRLACAKELKLSEVPVVISNTKLTNDDCYETINTTARRISSRDQIFIYINGGKVSSNTKKRIIELEKIIGTSDLKMFGEKYTSTAILSVGKKISEYCSDKQVPFVKKAILWVEKHKMTYLVRRAMEDGISKISLKKAITGDRPLKHAYK